MAEGEFQSSQGGVAAVGDGNTSGSYPSGCGCQMGDTRDVGDYPYSGGAATRVKSYPASNGTSVGQHCGSIEPHGGLARKTS